MNPIDLSRPQTEDQIPMLAAMAIEQAYEQALAAGQSVLLPTTVRWLKFRQTAVVV